MICQAGAASKPVRADKNRCSCPRCNEYLEQQDWDGIITLCCPNCRGTFFPATGLESVLDKLRATCDPKEVAEVMRDFKDRFTRELAHAVRYKACPVCSTVMTRRAYQTVSGVVIDQCGEHGNWVDEMAFIELTDFICRGGDVLASEVRKIRARSQPKRTRGGTLIDRLMGR